MIWKRHDFGLLDDLTTQSDKESHEEFDNLIITLFG